MNSALKVAARRIAGLFRTRRRDAWLNDEIQAHLDLLTDEYVRRGMSGDAARAEARREFGGVEHMKDTYRDQRGLPFVDALVQDVRYGARMLRKSPGFTSVAVLSLALGIGANTAVFTFVDAILLRALPVWNPQELVQIKAQRRGDFGLVSFPMYRDLRDRQQVFTDISAGAGEMPFRLTIPDRDGHTAELDNMRVSLVSGNYFAVLGVRPSAGRLITPDDDRNPESSVSAGSVVVLSDGLWDRQFGRDPGVLGRTILIGQSACNVIGVAPRGFFGEVVGASPAVWVPLVPFSSPDDLDNRGGVFTSYVARLKPRVGRERAQAAMTVLFQQLLKAEGRVRDHVEDNTIALAAADAGIDNPLRRTYATPLRIVMAIVALVLLIACANIANLLLARAASRRGEIGVRLAIGCSRARLVGQLLTESVMLSALGALAGVGFAYWGTQTLLGMISFGPVPVRLDLTPDARVLTFLVAVGILTGVAFGLVPALRATRVDLAPSLQGARRGDAGVPARQRLSRALVTAQVSLSLLLLIGAGLLIRSLHNLHNVDWGFRPEHVVVFDLAHNPQNRAPAALADVAWRAYERVKQIPGVESASVSGIMLFSPSDIGAGLTIRDYTPVAGERVTARYNSVSPGYFETVGMRLIDGRGIEDRDVQNGTPVAVINESLARKYFAGGRAVSRTMQIGRGTNASKPMEIVGVVRDAKYNNLREDAKPMFYVPFAQIPRQVRSVEVRTAESLPAITASVRQALADVSKDLMLRRVLSLSDQVDQSLAAERLIMRLCSFFGALALLLACVGLYGVMAYSVTQRTGEIGIRMALGATEHSILWLVLRETTRVVVVGVMVGVPLAFASTRLVSAFLFGLTATDPQTIALATLVLLTAAGVAAYLPARRAASVDPIVALRYE
jgi:predicted permease